MFARCAESAVEPGGPIRIALLLVFLDGALFLRLVELLEKELLVLLVGPHQLLLDLSVLSFSHDVPR
jgi:hypothetical protein